MGLSLWAAAVANPNGGQHELDMFYVIVAAAMLVLSFRNWRGALWIGALTASFFISGAWWRATGDGALFTFLCDTAVFIAMYAVGRYFWEFWLLCIQLAMMCASLSFTAFPFELEVYQISLELLNAIALFLIGGIGAYSLARKTDGRAFDHVRHILGFGFALDRQGEKR